MSGLSEERVSTCRAPARRFVQKASQSGRSLLTMSESVQRDALEALGGLVPFSTGKSTFRTR
jgi:hypothetical protein